MIKKTVFFLVFLMLFSAFMDETQSAEMSKADSLLNARKHFSFAVQYKKNEEYELAREQYKKSIALNDTVYQVHYSYADLLMKMVRSKDAKRHYLKSLSLNPEHYNSALMLAKIYYESALYDSTLIMNEKMYSLKPDNYEILSSIASLREYLGMNREALDAYNELIEKGQDSYENLMSAGKLAFLLEDYECAINCAKLALKKRSGDLDALRLAAETNLAVKHDKIAVNYLRQIAEIDSSDISVLVRLGGLCRSHSDIDNLIWALEKHYKLAPDNIDIIGELAELLYNKGMIDRSIEYVREGLKISPSDGKLRIFMGEYYMSMELEEKALKEFRIALSDDRWHSSAQRLIWKIQKPHTEEEEAEKNFFNRGKEQKQQDK